MQYKLIQKHNPANRKVPAKWYASPVNTGKVSAFQLSRQVIVRSKLNKDVVKKVVDVVSDEISKLLLDGFSVAFDELGTFRVSFSSEGVEHAEDFKADMINNVKVILPLRLCCRKKSGLIHYQPNKTLIYENENFILATFKLKMQLFD